VTTLLLVNPAAGGGRGERALPPALAAARKAWGHVEVVRTTGQRDAVELGRRAAEQGIERLIVVGGDGTIHEAANGLLGSGVAADSLPEVGIVPIGTGNDFARLTGTHGLSPIAAVARLAGGQRKLFDVGLAWGEYFVNSLGLGFDAVVASHVPRYRHLWRPLIYPTAVLRSYRSYRSVQVVVEGDDADYRGGIFCIEVGIGKSAGGGFFLTPGAEPDDGLFDVCLITPLSHLRFVTCMPTAFWGRHTRFREVRMSQTSGVMVRSDAPLLAHFDGEVRRGPDTIEIRIVENRLPVITARGDKRQVTGDK
jgi:YegS/Rv2252/BmrU family lipid kinase